jgi:hypothetical protein
VLIQAPISAQHFFEHEPLVVALVEAKRERGRSARTVHRLGARAPPAAGVGSQLRARTARFQTGFHSEKWKRAAVFIWKVSEWFQTKVEARRSFQLKGSFSENVR